MAQELPLSEYPRPKSHNTLIGFLMFAVIFLLVTLGMHVIYVRLGI